MAKRRIPHFSKNVQKSLALRTDIRTARKRLALKTVQKAAKLNKIYKIVRNAVESKPDDLFRRRLKFVYGHAKERPARLLSRDCLREYINVLSWRKSQASGGAQKRRSNVELQNNKSKFLKNCK